MFRVDMALSYIPVIYIPIFILSLFPLSGMVLYFHLESHYSLDARSNQEIVFYPLVAFLANKEGGWGGSYPPYLPI